MNNNKTTEPEVASYELTAAKTENEISEREMNELLPESADGAETQARNGRPHPVFHFFLRHFLWMIGCAAIFGLCIFCSNLFFESQDEKTLGAMTAGDLDTANTETQEQLTIYEKMHILNNFAGVTDLNYDSTDKYSYSDMHDLFVEEITDFFQCMELPFSVNGVYEMYIYKYLFTDNRDSAKSFTGWVTYITYYGFHISCILDYETQKIIALDLSTYETENDYHASADLEQLPDYGAYIEPLLTYQEDAYVGCCSSYYAEDKQSKNADRLSKYTALLRTYYQDDAIYSFAYGYIGAPNDTHAEETDSQELNPQNYPEVAERSEGSVTKNYNYYYFCPENVTDGNSSLVIEKHSSLFCFNRMDSY